MNNINQMGSTAKVLSQLNMEKVEKAAVEKKKKEEEAKAQGKSVDKAMEAMSNKKTQAYNAASYTTGRTSGSLTSTAVSVSTADDRVLMSHEEYMFPLIKAKGYGSIITNFGKINIELFCDQVQYLAHPQSYCFVSMLPYFDSNILFIPAFYRHQGHATTLLCWPRQDTTRTSSSIAKSKTLCSREVIPRARGEEASHTGKKTSRTRSSPSCHIMPAVSLAWPTKDQAPTHPNCKFSFFLDVALAMYSRFTN